jgi:uncharacterized membrane protein YphA (DoxX/SURF4 family)
MKVFYWIVSLLFVAQILFDAVLDLIPHRQAIMAFNKMEMPLFMLGLYGLTKLICGILVLIPGLRSVKEWAYAILLFGILEATWAMIASGQSADSWGFMAIPFILGMTSYILWRKINQAGDKGLQVKKSPADPTVTIDKSSSFPLEIKYEK